MPNRTILILGGTTEARELATTLSKSGTDRIVTSLAGVTSAPVLPDGETRQGGFGGAEGLRRYLEAESVDLLVDATHPYATQITASAHSATAQSGCPYLRLERPPWTAEAGDTWHIVPDIDAAARALPDGTTAFLTIGRQELGAFADRTDCHLIARMIERPDAPPERIEIVIGRPPFSIEDETALMRDRTVSVLVSKNAGGDRAKLDAARGLGLPVIMIDRPSDLPEPDAATVAQTLVLIADHNA